MISKSRIYLTDDRKTAVPAGDKSARSLLVIQGGEISDATLAKYAGAAELAAGRQPEPEKAPEPPTPPAPPEPPRTEPIAEAPAPDDKPRKKH